MTSEAGAETVGSTARTSAARLAEMLAGWAAGDPVRKQALLEAALYA